MARFEEKNVKILMTTSLCLRAQQLKTDLEASQCIAVDAIDQFHHRRDHHRPAFVGQREFNLIYAIQRRRPVANHAHATGGNIQSLTEAKRSSCHVGNVDMLVPWQAGRGAVIDLPR